jgi:hypothetical protein
VISPCAELSDTCNLSSRSKTESVEVTEGSEATSSQLPEETLSPKASAVLQEIADLIATMKGPGPHRRYVLERINGELVFRQTEIDAAIDAAIAALPDSGRTTCGRRIIKLPSP